MKYAINMFVEKDECRMRTPQKTFVVEFRSGRRISKAEVKSIWGDKELRAFASVADKSSHSGDLHNVSESIDGHHDADAVAIEGSSSISPVAKLASSIPEIEPPTGVDRGREAKISAKKVKTAPRSTEVMNRALERQLTVTRDPNVAKIATGVPDAQLALNTRSRNLNVVEELAALQAENNRLRGLYAEMVRSENLLLKKILERFQLDQPLLR